MLTNQQQTQLNKLWDDMKRDGDIANGGSVSVGGEAIPIKAAGIVVDSQNEQIMDVGSGVYRRHPKGDSWGPWELMP